MGKVIFRLNPHKKDSEGKLPVFCTSTSSGNRFQYYTGRSVLRRNGIWLNNDLNGTSPGFQEGNAYLDTLEEKVKKAHREAMLKGIVITTEELKTH